MTRFHHQILQGRTKRKKRKKESVEFKLPILGVNPKATKTSVAKYTEAKSQDVSEVVKFAGQEIRLDIFFVRGSLLIETHIVYRGVVDPRNHRMR